mmetsp:Transcript_14483/g.42198  ORF Transcript_14483/g.42198 Transcript_14483/m.42198 type:complete len:308 (-) Transcript_14483:958-1881(-)
MPGRVVAPAALLRMPPPSPLPCAACAPPPAPLCICANNPRRRGGSSSACEGPPLPPTGGNHGAGSPSPAAMSTWAAGLVLPVVCFTPAALPVCVTATLVSDRRAVAKRGRRLASEPTPLAALPSAEIDPTGMSAVVRRMPCPRSRSSPADASWLPDNGASAGARVPGPVRTLASTGLPWLAASPESSGCRAPSRQVRAHAWSESLASGLPPAERDACRLPSGGSTARPPSGTSCISETVLTRRTRCRPPCTVPNAPDPPTISARFFLGGTGESSPLPSLPLSSLLPPVASDSGGRVLGKVSLSRLSR